MNKESLLDRIKAKSHDDAGCWIWDAAMGSGGKTPVLSVDGKLQNARRAIAVSLGMKVTGMSASNTCDDRRCVCPDHIKLMTRSALQNRSAKALAGTVATFMRGKKIAESRRAKSDLTQQKVNEIRNAEGKQRDIAKAFGVSQYCVWSIQNYLSWKSYSNPYSQLMGAR